MDTFAPVANFGRASANGSPPRTSVLPKVPRKRKRVVISCTECHRRKQKCDRGYPCSNCVVRKKETSCLYENEEARKRQLLEDSDNTASEEGRRLGAQITTASSAQVSSFGYAKDTGNNNTTLGIFNRIEKQDGGDSEAPRTTYSTLDAVDHSALREKYQSQILRLPPKDLMKNLLATYFREVNYHYYPLDEGLFWDTLESWHALTFQNRKQAPISLNADMKFFPALLFSALALALQFQPPDYDPSLNLLKFAAQMSLDDLASEYSECGDRIITMLGKSDTTLITVQAHFLRTQYLKNCGLIPDSWHSLSQTIREAQEIGLHKDVYDRPPRNPNDTAEDVLEKMWELQLRGRMWTILTLWDVHMAIILGRPTTIDPRDGMPKLPIDAPVPKDRRKVAPARRLESDPPTPLTMLLWSAETSAPLWAIFNLEKEDQHQNNLEKVKQMHADIKIIRKHTPAFFRTEDPDTRFDQHPDCYWLPRARPTFQNSVAFTIMALHRPYIFTNSNSRTEALHAALDILAAQQTIFKLILVKDYKMFHLVLNTFDAIILVAAIYILHPSENTADLDTTLQHFNWAVERFQKMDGLNSMANSALGIVTLVYTRLKKALSEYTTDVKLLPPPTTSSVPTPESSSTTSESYRTSHNSVSSTSTLSGSTAWEPYPPSMSMPQSFDYSSMAPLQPMHDLVFGDLSTIGNNNMMGTDLRGMTTQGLMDANAWQFEGDFGNDSFWGFMNNYSS